MRWTAQVRQLGGLSATQIVAIFALSGCACQERPNITSPDRVNGKVGESFSYRIEADHAPTSFAANVPPPVGLSVK